MVCTISALVFIAVYLYHAGSFKRLSRNTCRMRWHSEQTRKEAVETCYIPDHKFYVVFQGKRREMQLFKKLRTVGCKEII